MIKYVRNDSRILKEIQVAEAIEHAIMKDAIEGKNDVNNLKQQLIDIDKKIIKLLKKCFKDT